MNIYDTGPYLFPVAVVILIAVAWFADLVWQEVQIFVAQRRRRLRP